MLVSCMAYSSTLKMEVTFLRNVIDFQWTIWRYIPEDRTLHNHTVRTTDPKNVGHDLSEVLWGFLVHVADNRRVFLEYGKTTFLKICSNSLFIIILSFLCSQQRSQSRTIILKSPTQILKDIDASPGMFLLLQYITLHCMAFSGSRDGQNVEYII
jgi:hypothetical protein